MHHRGNSRQQACTAPPLTADIQCPQACTGVYGYVMSSM